MGNFTDKDRGWKAMMTNFKVNSGETAGFVGYLRSSGDYKNESQRKKGEEPTPITMAQLAAVHENGSADGIIPQRSFMGSAIDEHQKEIKRLIKKVADGVVMGRLTKRKALGIVCERLKGMFIDKITSNVPPPLKQSTVDAKGSSRTLIDSGQLKNSMDWEIKEGK